MAGNLRYLITGMTAPLFVLALFVGFSAAEEVTLFGDVTESRQFETLDGEVININDNEAGQALRAQVGKHVEVTGTVEERERGVLFMTVNAFKEIPVCHGVSNAGRRLE